MTIIIDRFDTVEDLQCRLDMTNDAIEGVTAEGRTPEPKMFELKAAYEAAIDRLTGRVTNLPAAQMELGDEVGPGGRQAGSRAANQYGSNFQVEAASDRQVNFLRRLLDEKDVTGLKGVPTNLEGISKTRASAWIEKLIDRPNKAGVKPANAASPKQIEWVKKLLVEKDLTGTAFPAWTDQIIDSLDKSAASKALDMLFNLPNKTKPADPNNPLQAIEAGRYAIVGADGAVDFYQIDKPTEGKWAGWTFIRLLTGAPGDFNETPMRGAQGKAICQKILEAGMEESARLFGQKTRHCGHCMAPLTNDQSRAAGYGEVCASKHGYWYPSLKEALEILGEGV